MPGWDAFVFSGLPSKPRQAATKSVTFLTPGVVHGSAHGEPWWLFSRVAEYISVAGCGGDLPLPVDRVARRAYIRNGS